MIRLSLVVVVMLLGACATRPTTHNMPDSAQPNGLRSDRHYEVWVDADGNFFPDQWERLCGGHQTGAYALYDRARSAQYPDCTLELLADVREQTLREVADEFRGSELVTILIHGFNHGVGYQGDVRDNYNDRRQYIDRNISGISSHGYIDFFWNGLVSRRDRGLAARFAGTATAWRFAAINGERAGHLSLQPLLIALEDAQVQRAHILTHSLGAAVALAGLAGGKYAYDDVRDRNDRMGIPLPSRPLPAGQMEVVVTSTAPAIGRWHFSGGEEARWAVNQPARDLPTTVSSYFSTVNRQDIALRKLFGGFVVRRLNSTQFGQNITVAGEVAESMNQAHGEEFMTVVSVDMMADQADGPPLEGRRSHDATDYLGLRQVRQRLREVYTGP